MLSRLVITPRKKQVCFIPTRRLLQFPPSWLHIKVRKLVVFALNKSILYIIFLSQLPETCHVLISNLLTRYCRIIRRRSSCTGYDKIFPKVIVLEDALQVTPSILLIEIIDIECVLGHESCLHFFSQVPF